MGLAGTAAADGTATAGKIEGELQERVPGIPGILLHLSNDPLTLPFPPSCAACLLAPFCAG